MRKSIYKPGTASYAHSGILKLSLIVVCVLAVAAIGVAALILPKYTIEPQKVDKTVDAIVVQNGGLISIDPDLSKVFVTVKYTDGTESEFSLSEAIITGLDASKEQTLENVVIDIGGFKQKVTFKVVSSAKILKYQAGQGGLIAGDAEQRVFAGYDGTTVVAVPDEGYEFLRWSDGNPKPERTDEKVSRDMVITASFQKKKYTVVFYYPNETTASEEIVMHNEAATRVPLPSEREMQNYGHILVGWSEDYTHITQDTNIYPIYEKYATDLYLSFTKSIEGVNLGSAKDLKAFYPKGVQSTIRVEANPFRRFTGWTIQTYAGTEYLPPIMAEGETLSYPIGSVYNYVAFFAARTGATDEYTLSFTPTATTEELYITANFEYNTSNITFSTMGTTLSSIELPAETPIGVMFDVQPALYLDEATRDDYLAGESCPAYLKVAGYVFKGWYEMGAAINPDTGYPYFVTNDTTFHKPTSLIAYWEKNIYTVVFLQGDNQDSGFKDLEWYNPLSGMAEKYFDQELGGLVLTILYQDQLGGVLTGVFPESIPTKEYHTFSGWYVADAGGVATDELVDKTYKVTKSLRIVPVFAVIQRTLEIAVYGSGSVVRLENGAEIGVPGSYRMDATKEYVFRFNAGVGYSLSSVEVFNGVATTVYSAAQLHNLAENTYEYVVSIPILHNHTFKVNYTTTEFDITIKNGTGGVYGFVKHESDADLNNDPQQYVKVYNGQSKRIWINAPENYRIESIYVDSVLRSDLNSNAASYTLVLNNIAASVTVEVVYTAIMLDITVPGNIQNGKIDYENSKSAMGSSPYISVEADEGYYIKTLIINGIKVDPYNPQNGMSVSQLVSVSSIADAQQPQNAAGRSIDNDIRVTYYVLTFDFIASNKTIEVEFVPVYFYVDVDYSGVGSVSFRRQTVAGGSTVYVNANTSTTYYIHSYTYTNPSANFSLPNYVNQYEIVAAGIAQDTNIMLANIQRDIYVSVVFKRCKYTISFSNKDANQAAGEFAQLSYLVDERPVSHGLPYTLEMEALTSRQFTVNAIEGYYIEQIFVQTEEQVRDNPAAGTKEDIAFNAKSHTFTLDNITTGYSITVVCRIATYKIRLWLGNALPAYTIDGIAASYKETALSYGQTYSTTIEFDNTQSEFFASGLIVNGKDTVSTSTYGTQLNLEIASVSGNADIVVLFTPKSDVYQPHNVITKSDASGTLTALQEVDLNGIKIETGIENGQVWDGATVILKAAPIDSGYKLKHLIVNGVIVNADTNNRYVIRNVRSDIYAEAIFEDNAIPVILDMRNVFGMVSSPVTTFVYGSIVPVRIVAATGYNVSYIAIGSRSNQNVFSDTALAQFNGAHKITDYNIDTSIFTLEKLKEGLYVSVEFAPISFNLSISINGLGTLGQGYEAGIDKQIDYGTIIGIPIEADSNNFISYITVNGIVYNPFELRKSTVNAAIQKCINGELELTITSGTVIEIGFAPNVYRTTVVESWGGTTLVRTEGGIYTDGYDLELYAGQNLEIYMLAGKEQGTHISELYINGELIRPEYWKLDLYSPNNNRSITYTYRGPNNGGIVGNVHIKVVYEINKYTIAVNLKNKSLNFRTVNTNPTTFGTVELKGMSMASSQAFYDKDSYYMTVQTYTGIEHGSTVHFSFYPVVYDGYRIDLDTAVITYYDPNDTTSSEAKVIALKTFISAKDGIFILPSLGFDIESVYLEFVKAKYTYSLDNLYNSMGSPYMPEVSQPISIRFANPYLPANDVVVETINNVSYYEEGLDFTVDCVPGEGYAISSFTLNGESRLNSMKGNSYAGRIVDNIRILAQYSITTHRVSFATNLTETQLNSGLAWLSLYSSDNQLLWKPGMAASALALPLYTPDGTVIAFNSAYITVTYNTKIKYTAAPNFDGFGYKIDYLTINSSYQNIANPDIENAIEHTVTALTKGQVNFSVHYYNINILYFEGGTGVVSGSSSVKWNSDCSVVINVFAGYKLNAIIVNGTADAGLLASAKKTTLNDASTQYEFDILHIKSDKNITIQTERLAYDMTFDGGFMESFEVLGILQDSVTGVIFNKDLPEEAAYFSKQSAYAGSKPLASSTVTNDPKRYAYSGYRYKDSVTIYFMPIDGYKIKNVTVTMRTLKGVVNTVINNIDSLVLLDSRYGHYYYKINEATGAISVTVNYEIKTYNALLTTTGRGNITKVELNDYVQPGTVVTLPRTVNHYDIITVEFTADYGYHLDTLIINGRRIEAVQYEKITKQIEGTNRVVYKYTTDTLDNTQNARMIINSAVINGKSSFTVEAEFAINTFAVRTFINGRETDTDTALGVSLSNTKMEYNSNYTIFQNITEGYSITDLTFKTNAGLVIMQYLMANPADAAILKSSQYVFIPTGAYIDYLDYHDTTGSSSMLFVYYNTIINTHTSVIDPYLYEYEKVGNDYVLVANTASIPMVNKVTSGGTVSVPAYSLTRTFNNIPKDNAAIHNYGVEAKFKFFMDPAATSSYVFAGYQIFDNGVWRYVKSTDSGFVLSSSSVSPTGEAILDTLEYTIKSNIAFRAVVYRMYEVTVEVHPEYKWQSGTLSLSNFNMKYMQYANLAATVYFDSGMNPNLPSSMLTLADNDGISDASYTYKIYCGARLNLSLTDTKATLNPVTGTSYYDISYNTDGHLVQTQRSYGTANTVIVNSDRLVHAYANNDKMHLDVALETQGEAVGSEGGSVKYYVYNTATGQYVSKTISNNALLVPTNSVVKLEITPKTSYRIDGVYQVEAQNNAVNGYQVFIPDSWIKLESLPDNTVSISKTGDTTVVVMRLIENTVIKVKFWKQMEVTNSIKLLYGDTERTIDPSEATGMFANLKYTQASESRLYDYESDITYTVPLISENDKWNLRYQFVGFFVNDVNSYRQLDTGYPDSNTVSYRLYNYDAVERPDGVTMVRGAANEKFKVNIVAKYVLIFNISFINEYKYLTDGGDVYFDPGYYSSDFISYNPDSPIYYTDSTYIWPKKGALDYTDKSIQMYGKINNTSAVGDNRETAASPYNTWTNNYIMLNWSRSLDENPNAAGFVFIEWQYWGYNGSSWSWMTLPDTNPNDQNKPTNVSYQLTVNSLFQHSYLNYLLSDWSVPASMYGEDDEYVETKNIQTIQIRPLFQRKEDINIKKIVYTEAYGIPDEGAASLGPAVIEDSGSTEGTYNYYDIVTLKPGNRSGLRFLGWYYSATGLESDYILVTEAAAGGSMNASRNYQLVNYQEQNGEVIYGGDLKIRLVGNTIVKAVYIRIWNVTVKVFNDSGDTAHMVASAPILNYYGVATQVDGQEIYGTPQQVTSRNKVMVLQAGEKVKFQLLFAGTQYSPLYDRYDSIRVFAGGVLQEWINTTEAINSRNVPIKGESAVAALEAAQFIIVANQQKAVEIVFRSYGQLKINNIYPGSSLVLPTDFYNTMKAEYGATNMWDINSIADNGPADSDPALGSILIKDIPIKKESTATYDGVFKNKLPSMGGNYALTPSAVSSFNINFSGAVLGGTFGKYQSFTYFNTTDGGSDGISKMDMPFYTSGSNYGKGTSDSPFIISTVNHLKYIDIFVASNGNTAAQVYFRLNNNLDVSTMFTGASPYNGIGKDIPFDGIFDGYNYSLHFSGTVTIGAIANFGVFRRISSATIRNVKLGQADAITINAYNSAVAGYLVGTAANSIIENISTAAGRISINGKNTVGGIVGTATGSTIIRNSTISCQLGVQAMEAAVGIAGGIVGGLYNTSRVESVNFGTGSYLQLVAVRYAGGIAGKIEGDSSVAITGCSTYLPRLDSSAYQAIGGIAGFIGVNRRVQNSSIKSESSALTFYSGNFSSFNSSSLASSETAGGGLIAGINNGAISGCTISSLSNVTMIGAFSGGIAGVNIGTIESCTSTSVYITTTKTSANTGGTFGAITGYNKGIINNVTLNGNGNSSMSFDYCNFSVRALTYNADPFQTTGVNPTQVSPVSDNGYIYLGGFAGYNASGGRITNSITSGAKMLINRWCNNRADNYNYNGIIVGYNASGNTQSTGNKMTNSRAFVYISVAADDGINKVTGSSTIYNYVGDLYGYNNSGSIAQSDSTGNSININAIAIGSVIPTDWSVPAPTIWTTNTDPGRDASGYYSSKIKYAITAAASTSSFTRASSTSDLHSLSTGVQRATNYYWGWDGWLYKRFNVPRVRYIGYLRYMSIA